MIALLMDNDGFRIKEIERDLRKKDKNIIINVCTTKENAIQIADGNAIDMFIISIAANFTDGIEFLSFLESSPSCNNSSIALVMPSDARYETMHDDAMNYFVLKSCKIDGLVDSSHSGVSQEKSKGRLIAIKNRYKILSDSIIYIEINYKTLYIVAQNHIYEISRFPLKDIIVELPPEVFVQCHRSYYVNINKILSIENVNHKEFLNVGIKKIPVGNKFRNYIHKAFYCN